jgi:hypothetical protein
MSSLIPWRGEMDRLRNERERLYDKFFDLRPFRRFTEEGEWTHGAARGIVPLNTSKLL